MYELVIDDEWIRRKPRWDKYRDWPISFVWVWNVPQHRVYLPINR